MKNKAIKGLSVFALAVAVILLGAGCSLFGPKVSAIELGDNFSATTEMINNESVLVYEINEDLDVSNASIIVQYDDETNEEVDITRSMVTGFSTTTKSQSVQEMTITYKGKSCKVKYVVVGMKLAENYCIAPGSQNNNYSYNAFIKNSNGYTVYTYVTENAPSAEFELLKNNTSYIQNVNAIAVQDYIIEFDSLNITYNIKRGVSGEYQGVQCILYTIIKFESRNEIIQEMVYVNANTQEVVQQQTFGTPISIYGSWTYAN